MEIKKETKVCNDKRVISCNEIKKRIKTKSENKLIKLINLFHHFSYRSTIFLSHNHNNIVLEKKEQMNELAAQINVGEIKMRLTTAMTYKGRSSSSNAINFVNILQNHCITTATQLTVRGGYSIRK